MVSASSTMPEDESTRACSALGGTSLALASASALALASAFALAAAFNFALAASSSAEGLCSLGPLSPPQALIASAAGTSIQEIRITNSITMPAEVESYHARGTGF